MIAYFDESDYHHNKAHQIIAQVPVAERRISVVTYAETMVGAEKEKGEILERTELFFMQAEQAVIMVDMPIARAAAKLRSVYPAVKLPDSLIVATAKVTQAEALITFDNRLRKIDKLVKVLS